MNMSKQVVWPAMLEDADKTIESYREIAPAWNAVSDKGAVSTYLANLKVLWLVVVMCMYLDSQSKIRYITNLFIPNDGSEKALADNLNPVQSLTLDRINVIPVAFPHLGGELVIIIVIDRAKIEVFSPWTTNIKSFPKIHSIMCKLLHSITKQFVPPYEYPEDCFKNVYVYHMPQNAQESNVWVSYFLSLRSQFPRAETQAKIMQADIRDCVGATQRLGSAITNCIKSVKTPEAEEAVIGYFGQSASFPLAMSRNGFSTLRKLFSMCKTVAYSRVKTNWPPGFATNPKWEMYVELPDATKPQFIFLPVALSDKDSVVKIKKTKNATSSKQSPTHIEWDLGV